MHQTTKPQYQSVILIFRTGKCAIRTLPCAAGVMPGMGVLGPSLGPPPVTLLLELFPDVSDGGGGISAPLYALFITLSLADTKLPYKPPPPRPYPPPPRLIFNM